MKAAVITPPGFESEALAELREMWPFLLQKNMRPNTEAWPEWQIGRGCLEGEIDAFLFFQLNFFCRLASRILARVLSKKVTSRAQVFEQLSRFAWSQHFAPARTIAVHLDLQSPLVNNEKWLREKLFADRRFGFTKPYDALVSLRGERLEISLNSSGEHLHKRGGLRARGEAPLRETIAHFCLRKLIHSLPLAERHSLSLVDPMVGSGTFLYEALHFGASPLVERGFGFQEWLTSPKIFRQDFLHNYRNLRTPLFSSLWGADQDPQVVRLAQQNLANEAGRPDLQILQGDFYERLWEKAVPPSGASAGRLMIFNPPYGQRLKIGDHQSLEQAVLAILPQFQRVGVLTPQDWRAFREVEASQHQVWPIANQGLACEFHILSSCKTFVV